MSTFRAATLLAVIASVSAAFVPSTSSLATRHSSFTRTTTATTSTTKPITTPTTLFYRDDMNPRDHSSTKWQTPNNFDQFLTQCSIQSLMVLLQSLRDDPTAVWLHEFTDPVMRVNRTATSSIINDKEQLQQDISSSSKPEAPPSAKISLDLAVQAALDEPAQLLKPFHKKKKKKKKKSNKQQEKPNMSSTAAARSKKIAKPMPSSATTTMNKKKKQQQKSLRKKRPLAKTAFAAFSQQATFLSEAFDLCDVDDEECNTDIAALYSNSHMFAKPKKTDNTNNQESSSTTTDVSSLYSSSPMTRRGNVSPPVRKQAWSPKKKYSNNDNSKNTNSCTNALYAAPAPSENDEQSDATALVAPQQYKLWKYHGLATLNATKFPTSMTYFEQLLRQPKQTWKIAPKHAPSYDLEIDPASLCSRLLSVRNQIAQEFQHDLSILAGMGADTLKSYWTMREDQRKHQNQEKREESKSQEQKEHDQRLLQHGKHYQGELKDNSKIPKNKLALQRPNLLFLDQAPPTSTNPDYTPSPCRKGNFDLLHLMSTQEAIHRVLNDPQRQARKSAEHGSNQFLQDFYVARLWSHFSGDQPYGRADDFLEELLDCSPRLVTVGSGDGDSVRNAKDVDTGDEKADDAKAGKEGEDALTKDLTYLIDPVGIAETILNEREKVAQEWQEQVADQTQLDHMKIQKLVLAKLMECSSVEECMVEDPPEIELAFTSSGSMNQAESIFE